MLFEKIILQSAKQFSSERSPVAIYHLLTGRKSIQTVQDAHMYKLASFYGILPNLKINFFNKYMKQFKKTNHLKVNEQNFLKITRKGNKALEKYKGFQTRGFNGLTYHQRDIQFMNRLLLFIQILSNSKRGNYNYIPIVEEREYTVWARQIYHEIKGRLNEVTQQLEGELLAIGENLKEEEINIFIDRLTGYNIYGKSIYQLASKYKYKAIDIQLILVKVIHIIMNLIIENKSEYTILASILPKEKKEVFLTNSAANTHRLLLEGMDVEEIAKRRNLRLNTILDHIVEISLYDEFFPYEKFLSDQVEKEIFHVLSKLDTFKLKEIKDHLQQNISYFEIRLALSKYNRTKDGNL